MRRITGIALAAALLLGLSACELITDFELASEDLYSLEANMSDTIEVSLLPNEHGEIVLELADPLPDASEETLRALLADGTITLAVQKTGTEWSFTLADGEETSSITTTGDYHLELSADRTVVTIVFYNEVEDAQGGFHSLDTDGDYTASITVQNNDYFLTESFTVEVDVTE